MIHKYHDEGLGSPFEGSASKIQEHICKSRHRNYLNTRDKTYFGHHEHWKDICYEIAGKSLSTFSAETFSMIKETYELSSHKIKRTYHLLNYDKFVNVYAKFKMQYRKQTENDEHSENSETDDPPHHPSLNDINRAIMTSHISALSNTSETELLEIDLRLHETFGEWLTQLPPCPCCTHLTPPGCIPFRDSITHLLYECKHDQIASARSTMISNLRLSAQQLPYDQRRNFHQLIDTLDISTNSEPVSLDSRQWAGAFHSSVLGKIFPSTPMRDVCQLIAKIQKSTLPTTAYIWNLYCKLTHPPKERQPDRNAASHDVTQLAPSSKNR